MVEAPCALGQAATAPALRIATLSDGDQKSSAPLWQMFRERLRELGYAENSYAIEQRWARSDPKRLVALAAEIARSKPRVIVADGTSAALAARGASADIPIVAIRISDPVKAGLASSLAQPAGNVTGTSIVTADIAGKWIELLREVAPATRSIAFLNDTSNPGAMITFQELQERARPLGVKVRAFDGRDSASIGRAFDTIARERWDSLVVGTNAVVFGQLRSIVETAARERIPAIYARHEYVDAGGLMSYGANLGVHYSYAADYVHRIAQGARPSDIPIEQPTRFQLVINLKTARALGVKIPPAVLLRADRIIE